MLLNTITACREAAQIVHDDQFTDKRYIAGAYHAFALRQDSATALGSMDPSWVPDNMRRLVAVIRARGAPADFVSDVCKANDCAR